MDTPWDPKGRSALVRVVDASIDEGTAVLDEVLDQNTPGNGLPESVWITYTYQRVTYPLLQRHHSTSDFFGRNLGLVHWNDGGTDTDGVPTDKTTNTEESNAVGGGLQNSANNPDEGGDLYSVPTRKSIGEEGRRQSTNERTCRHRRSDTTLASAARVAEVVLVSGSTQRTRHRRDVETEENATKRGEAANGVHIVDLWEL